MLRRLACLTAACFALASASRAGAAPPVIECPAAQSSYETATIAFTVAATDADGDPVELVAVDLPRRATFDAPSGSFIWNPDYTQAGSYALEFRAIAAGESTACTVPVTIANFNRLPVLTCPAPAVAAEGDTIRVRFVASDPDGDVLAWSATPMPPGATLSSQGELVWPTAGVAPGTYESRIEVTDGGLGASCTWSASILERETLPQIHCPGAQAVMATRTLTFDVVLEGGRAPLALSAAGLPAGASFNAASAVFSWTPSESQVGAHEPRFMVRDASGFADTCAVPITVTELVVPPPTVGCAPPANGVELDTLRITFDASDPEGRALTLDVSPLPAGAVLDAPARRITWRPAIGQAGDYVLRITADNGVHASSCDQRITIQQRLIASPAFPCPPPKVVAERRPLTFTVTATDPLGLPLVYAAEDLPRGAVFDTLLRRFDWTPGPDQAGSYAPRLLVSNGYAPPSTCTVPITVEDRPPSGPAFTCPDTIVTLETRMTRIPIQAYDPEDDPLQWVVRGLPPGATFEPGVRRLDWKPDTTQAGSYRIEIVASDGEVRDSCTYRIAVLDHVGPLSDYEPVIYAAGDVRPDQGGWVRLEFVTPAQDVYTTAGITGYNIWRRVGPSGSASAATPEGAAVTGFRAFPPGTWETVAFSQAIQATSMRIIAPTRRDSTAGPPAPEVYVVSAHTRDPGVWFVSNPESAYSVDDLPPAAPALRIAPAAELPGALRLSWNASEDPDLARFEVHRGPSGDFEPSDATRLATTEDTTWLDPTPQSGTWYRVVARDLNGNASASDGIAASPGPTGSTAIALGAPRPTPTSGGVECSFELGTAQHVRVTILDARGRRIRLLLDGTQAAGPHQVAWDGRDERGAPARAGVYFLRLEGDADAQVRKVVKLGGTVAAGS